MADQDKENRRTRRAKRREQAESSPSGASEREQDDAEQEAPRAGSSARAEKSAPPQGRRESIRDRNQRLREKAAEGRRQRRTEEKTDDVGAGLGAGEMVDDVLARTAHTVTRWVKRHSMLVQSAIVLGFVSLIGVSVWRIYWRDATAKRSDALFTGVETALAPVGESPEILNPEGRSLDPRPTFATAAERNSKAEDAYRAVAGSGKSVAVLAQLGLAGVLFDQGKYEEARAAYDAVRGSRLAEKNLEFKARSIEGVGLALEAKGDTEGASKLFGELENLSEPMLSNLGTFHRARLAMQKGNQQQAKELVGKLKEKLDKPADENLRFSYTTLATAELSQTLDPTGAWMPGLTGLEDTKKSVKDMQRWVEEISKGNLPADLLPAGSASAAAPVPAAPAGSTPVAPTEAAPKKAPAAPAPAPAPASSP